VATVLVPLPRIDVDPTEAGSTPCCCQADTAQDEVSAALRSPLDFLAGTPALLRDSDRIRRVGFTVRDGSDLSARWPGDAHRFAYELAGMRAQR
jgi:hypothetical protein